jgi:isocitrate/isopropylmalate dehydrogenase
VRALFEPVHGSAPDIAGQGRANPLGAIRCVALLLDHFGHEDAARAVDEAVAASLADGVTTPDLGGTATTAEVGRWIADALDAGLAGSNLAESRTLNG